MFIMKTKNKKQKKKKREKMGCIGFWGWMIGNGK